MARSTQALFWITDIQDPKSLDIVMALQEVGYETYFFKTVPELLKKLPEKRSRVILFGLHGKGNPKPDEVVEKQLFELASVPELNGASLILEGYDHSSRIKSIAASCNFREILPRRISDNQFVNRILIAVNRKSIQQVWKGMAIHADEKAAAFLPARMTWIDAEEIRVEAGFVPPVGAKIWLKGDLFQDLGIDRISVQIRSLQRQDLSYRFSHAFIAEWGLQSSSSISKQDIVDKVKANLSDKQEKVFLAVQNPKIREKLSEYFTREGYDVRTALSRNSVLREPLFLTPDVIVFEDALLSNDGFRQELLSTIKDKFQPSHFVLISAEGDPHEVLSLVHPERKGVLIDKSAQDLNTRIMRELPKASQDQNSKKGFFAINHPSSLVEALLPCRVQTVSPHGGNVVLPTYVKPFSIFRLEWTGFKKGGASGCYIKSIHSGEDTTRTDRYRYSSVFLFADLPPLDQKAILSQSVERLLLEWEGFLDVSQFSHLADMPEVEAEGGQESGNSIDYQKIKKISSEPATLYAPDLHEEHHYSGGVDIDPSSQSTVPFRRTEQKWYAQFLREYKSALLFVCVLGFIFSVLYFSLYVLAPNAPSSGKIFSEQFSKFADPRLRTKPSLEERDKEKEKENEKKEESE